jgi:hypothetical protein
VGISQRSTAVDPAIYWYSQINFGQGSWSQFFI